MDKPCVIFDLDGTLADVSHRLHHVKSRPPNWPAFFDGCVDDAPNVSAIELLGAAAEQWPVVICSGRPDTHRAQTEDWLRAHVPAYRSGAIDLHMRAGDDYRADTVVKAEMLAAIRANGFEPLFSVDDRPSVIEMWRANGVPCLAVANDQWNETTPAADLEGKTLLTLMVGPSGAGKTTWLASDAPALQSPPIHPSHVLSSDQFRDDLCGDWADQTKNAEVFGALHEIAVSRLKHGLPVVVDATNIRRRDRRAIVDLAPAGTRVRYIVLDRPLADKLRDARTPGRVIRKHDQTFKSQIRDILSGDGVANVDVVDLRGVA